jgi:hypothetical protein
MLKRLMSTWVDERQAPQTTPLGEYTEPNQPVVLPPDKHALAQELEQRQRRLRSRVMALEAQAEVETRRHQH